LLLDVVDMHQNPHWSVSFPQRTESGQEPINWLILIGFVLQGNPFQLTIYLEPGAGGAGGQKIEGHHKAFVVDLKSDLDKHHEREDSDL
jgi:hypothetical protein